MGLNVFAAQSDGKLINNPRYYEKSLDKLRCAQRKLSKSKKWSNNRKKHRFSVARKHLKIVNQREDFLHKESLKIANSFSLISVEDLNIRNMLHSNLSRSIHDVSCEYFYSDAVLQSSSTR